MTFYILHFLILFSSLVVVLAGNAIVSILFLIIVFLLISLLFIYVGANFLSFVLIMVYVGAVTVLFLFVVMMLDTRYIEYYKLSNSILFCAFISIFYFLVISCVFYEYIYIVDISNLHEN